jgi:hypothetical protein
MATKVVGKLDNWGEGDLGGSMFMNLDEGENQVRILTSPYQFYIHWTKDAAGQSRKLRCALEGCPLCQRGEKPVARWYIGVLNRKANKPAVLEIGPQIFKQILALSKKPKWGDPKKYDVDVTKQPKGSQPLYVVQPLPIEDLTKEEITMVKAFIKDTDLAEMSKASTVEEINERMGISAPKAAAVEVDNNFETAATEEDDWFDEEK